MHTELKQIIYLPNSLGVSKETKQKKPKNNQEKQLSCKWLVTEKWQSLCFYLFIPSRKAGKGIRPVFSFSVGTD